MAPETTHAMTEWEDSGRFGLSISPKYYKAYGDGDLGRGSGQYICYFGSAEARGYFKQMREAQNQAREALMETVALARALKGLLTPAGRVRRKKLLALIASVGPK